MRTTDQPAPGSVQPDPPAPPAPRYRVCWRAVRTTGGGRGSWTSTKAEAQAQANKLNVIYAGQLHHWIEPVPAVEQAP